jgi:hypothetical protein
MYLLHKTTLTHPPNVQWLKYDKFNINRDRERDRKLEGADQLTSEM